MLSAFQVRKRCATYHKAISCMLGCYCCVIELEQDEIGGLGARTFDMVCRFRLGRPTACLRCRSHAARTKTAAACLLSRVRAGLKGNVPLPTGPARPCLVTRSKRRASRSTSLRPVLAAARARHASRPPAVSTTMHCGVAAAASAVLVPQAARIAAGPGSRCSPSRLCGST